jgi:GMP synthase-like glutamine amidotransferase
VKIQCLTHVPFEDAANIAPWAESRGHSIRYTNLYQRQPLPGLNNFDMLAIMGGLMNVYEHDKYPWLVAEKNLIKRAIDAGKKVLGVCLGAQLMSDVLGGVVTKNPYPEIGWHPVTLTDRAAETGLFDGFPETFTVFQWHGDTFSTPPGAVLLARGEVCRNQAFLHGPNALALQFHLEYSRQSIEAMLANCRNDLIDSLYVNSADQIREKLDQVLEIENRLYAILDRFSSCTDGISDTIITRF